MSACARAAAQPLAEPAGGTAAGWADPCSGATRVQRGGLARPLAPRRVRGAGAARGAADHHAGYPRACLGCGAAASRDLLGQLIEVQRLELCERARHVLADSREQRGVSSLPYQPRHNFLRFCNPGAQYRSLYAKSGQLVQLRFSKRPELPVRSVAGAPCILPLWQGIGSERLTQSTAGHKGARASHRQRHVRLARLVLDLKAAAARLTHIDERQ